MLCVVQKAFGGPEGAQFRPGQLIETGGYRNRETLIAGRYMRLATPDEINSAIEVDEEEVAPRAPMTAKKTKKGIRR